jgi:hypothetical protein
MEALMMSPRRRELIFKVTDGYLALLKEGGVMHYLTKFRRCDQILLWLDQNGFRGHTLESWVIKHWRHHKLSMVKFILMKLDKETSMQPIFLGEEYMPRR